MNRAGAIGWRMQGLLLTLALTAVLFRAAIPGGWMVSPQAVGGFPLVLCAYDGRHAASVEWADAEGKLKGAPQAPAQQDSDGDPACVFAAHLAVPAPELATAVVAVVTPAAVLIAGPSRDLVPGRGLPAPPPPATGPPHLI